MTPASAVRLRDLVEADWPAVRAIYLEGIATGVATFETSAPSWDAWNAGHHPEPRLLAERDGEPIGWAALAPVSARPVYRGVAEVSIYVAERARGSGIGRALLERLVAESERHDFWTLQAAIMAGNAASIALHLACGFREVGRRNRLGALHGTWHDVVLLERRSAMTGAGPTAPGVSASRDGE